MFSLSTIRESVLENTLINNINKVVQDNRSPLFDILEFNDHLNDIETSGYCEYYSLLCNSSIGSISMNEGVVSSIIDKILKLIQTIIDKIKTIVQKIYLYIFNSTEKFESVKKETRGFNINFDERKFEEAYKKAASSDSDKSKYTPAYKEKCKEASRKRFEDMVNKEFTFTVYRYPSEKDVDDQAPRSSISQMIGYIEDICNGKSIGVAEESSLMLAFKALSVKTKASRSDYKGKINSRNTYEDFVKTNVCYSNNEVMKFKDWINNVVNKAEPLSKQFVEKSTQAMIDDLNKISRKLKDSKSNIIDDNDLKAANTYLGYINQIVDAWIWFARYVVTCENKNLDNIIRTFRRLEKSGYNIKGFVNESSTIFGEPFDSNTVFDNEDLYDFNRTEWLDLSLTTECYAAKYEINNYIRRIYLQEALIISDDNPNKVKRLIAMKEAENNNLKSSISSVISNIRKIIDKFLSSLNDKIGINNRYITVNMEAIKKPINPDMKANSKGDIIAGMYRVQDNINFINYDFNALRDSLSSKESFFLKHIASSLNKSSNFSKRSVNWNDDMSITDFCKAYYGASMPDDKYRPCEFTGKDFEVNKDNMIKLLKSSNSIINSIKADIDKLENQSKKISINEPQQSNQQQSNDNAKQESYYSIIYSTFITEADIENPSNTNNSNNNGNNNTANTEASAFKVYIDTYKDILLSKITAIEFITSEFMQILQAHTGVKLGGNREEK